MVESKEHNINPLEIQEDDLTEQMHYVELVRYNYFFFCSLFLFGRGQAILKSLKN